MHHFFLFLFLLIFLLPRETSYSAAAASGGDGRCIRRCGSTTVPYPFGFSDGCPIVLSCDANTSTPVLPYKGDNGPSYHVVSFNSTASTVVVGLLPSCSRSVSDAKRALSGANYGVSSRTALFLRGGCLSNTSVCSVPAAVMSRMFRTAQCSNDTSATAVSCVASAAPNASVARTEQFLRWELVERQDCNDVMTSAVYMDTPEGTMSQEYAVAELGWWVNGTCAGHEAGGQCVAEARCADVDAPRGVAGHRCACMAGMHEPRWVLGWRRLLRRLPDRAVAPDAVPAPAIVPVAAPVVARLPDRAVAPDAVPVSPLLSPPPTPSPSPPPAPRRRRRPEPAPLLLAR